MLSKLLLAKGGGLGQNIFLAQAEFHAILELNFLLTQAEFLAT
jgi:hypothetical protein